MLQTTVDAYSPQSYHLTPRLRDTPADRNLAKQRLIIDSGRSVCHTTEEKGLFI
jgi:hypothetical protein